MATHFSIRAWKNPWTVGPGRLQSMRSQRVRHDRVTEHSSTSTLQRYHKKRIVKDKSEHTHVLLLHMLTPLFSRCLFQTPLWFKFITIFLVHPFFQLKNLSEKKQKPHMRKSTSFQHPIHPPTCTGPTFPIFSPIIIVFIFVSLKTTY